MSKLRQSKDMVITSVLHYQSVQYLKPLLLISLPPPTGNPLTEKGLGYLTCFQKLCELNISDTNVKVTSFSLQEVMQSSMLTLW